MNKKLLKIDRSTTYFLKFVRKQSLTVVLHVRVHVFVLVCANFKIPFLAVASHPVKLTIAAKRLVVVAANLIGSINSGNFQQTRISTPKIHEQIFLCKSELNDYLPSWVCFSSAVLYAPALGFSAVAADMTFSSGRAHHLQSLSFNSSFNLHNPF